MPIVDRFVLLQARFQFSKASLNRARSVENCIAIGDGAGEPHLLDPQVPHRLR